MSLLLFYLAVAAAGGTIALARPVRLPRGWSLLALAALPQLLTIAGVRHSALALLSLAFCLAWAWQNRDLPGVALLAAGLSLNLLVMAIHGGSMPIRAGQLAELGLHVAPGSVLPGVKDSAVAASPIWWLGDWMPVSTPLISLVASPGDLLVLVGLVRWLFASGAPKRTQTDDAPRTDPAGALPAPSPRGR